MDFSNILNMNVFPYKFICLFENKSLYHYNLKFTKNVLDRIKFFREKLIKKNKNDKSFYDTHKTLHSMFCTRVFLGVLKNKNAHDHFIVA